MNALDIGILIIISASGLIGLIRGLTSEVLSLVSWIGAGAAAYFGFPLIRDIAQGYIESPMLADSISIIVIFIVFLILLSILSHTLSNFVKGSVLGNIDRSLGLAFGLTRGFVVLCVVDIVLGMLVARTNPPLMIQQSRFSPLILKSSETFVHLLPSQIKDYVTIQTLRQMEDFEKKQKELFLTNPQAVGNILQENAEIPKVFSPSIQDPQKTAESLAQLKPQVKHQEDSGTKYNPTELREMDRLLETVKNR